MDFFRTSTYEKGLKRLRKLGASKTDLDAIETMIAANPEAGDIIKGSGGLRKIRFAYGAAVYRRCRTWQLASRLLWGRIQ